MRPDAGHHHAAHDRRGRELEHDLRLRRRLHGFRLTGELRSGVADGDPQDFLEPVDLLFDDGICFGPRLLRHGRRGHRQHHPEKHVS